MSRSTSRLTGSADNEAILSGVMSSLCDGKELDRFTDKLRASGGDISLLRGDDVLRGLLTALDNELELASLDAE